jgi:hypothetical protein
MPTDDLFTKYANITLQDTAAKNRLATSIERAANAIDRQRQVVHELLTDFQLWMAEERSARTQLHERLALLDRGVEKVEKDVTGSWAVRPRESKPPPGARMLEAYGKLPRFYAVLLLIAFLVLVLGGAGGWIKSLF